MYTDIYLFIFFLFSTRIYIKYKYSILHYQVMVMGEGGGHRRTAIGRNDEFHLTGDDDVVGRALFYF